MTGFEECATIAKLLLRGKVVPFLGAGVNLCGPRAGVPWQQAARFPSGTELAAHLAAYAQYSEEDATNLSRISQYIATTEGDGNLYDVLRSVFDVDHEPTAVHEFLARVPGYLRASGVRYQVIVTTNYDDALERAFRARGEAFDVLTYLALDHEEGSLYHELPDGTGHVIKTPNEYDGVSPEERTVIVKVHGAVHRLDRSRDSFVITEEDYIDYLTRSDATNLLPAPIVAALQSNDLLFLGYSLRDWNLRVILHRLWGARRLNYESWAVLLHPKAIDRKMWARRGVTILDLDLEEMVHALEARITELAVGAGG